MSTDQRLRAALVDDSVAIRVGVPAMLPGFDFVSVHADVDSLLAERPNVDLVVLDLRLATNQDRPTTQGPAAIRAVVAAGYRTCVYTDERRRFVLAQCLRAGAAGVVHKADPVPAVDTAFRQVAAGESVVTQSLVGLAELADRRDGMPELTERQRAVLRGRARGRRWADIARELCITDGVAREHMNAVNAKFARYLVDASPADLERHLGLAPGDLLAD